MVWLFIWDGVQKKEKRKKNEHSFCDRWDA